MYGAGGGYSLDYICAEILHDVDRHTESHPCTGHDTGRHLLDVMSLASRGHRRNHPSIVVTYESTDCKTDSNAATLTAATSSIEEAVYGSRSSDLFWKSSVRIAPAWYA